MESVKDLTGYSARAQLRKTKDADKILLLLLLVLIPNPTTGKIKTGYVERN